MIRLFLWLMLLFPLSADAQTELQTSTFPALPKFSLDHHELDAPPAPYCRDIPEDVKPHCAQVLLGNYERALKKIADFGPNEEIKNAANKSLLYDIRGFYMSAVDINPNPFIRSDDVIQAIHDYHYKQPVFQCVDDYDHCDKGWWCFPLLVICVADRLIPD